MSEVQYCKICGHQTIAWHHPRTQMLFHKCEFCELIVKDKSHYVSLEEEKIKYDKHQNDEGNLGYVNYLFNFYEQAIKPYMIKGHILDFGSGPNPVFQSLLIKEGYEVEIYDYFYAPSLKYRDKAYDLISTIEVVEHLQDPLKTFKHFKDLLKPGGYISVMTLFHLNDYQSFKDWFYIRDTTHVSFYTSKTLRVIADILDMEFIDTNDYRYGVLRKKEID
jgi:SAM-dependent methyltransferase